MNALEGILGFLGAAIQFIFLILFNFYGWVVVVAVLGYLIIQNRRKTQWISEVDTILLLIEVPKDNDKKELSAEQMFASLHGILRPKSELIREGSLQEHISFEIVARQNSIQFYVWCPVHLKDFVESQIYAQYPTVQIKEGTEDYSQHEIGERAIYGTELSLTKDDVLPIKTFASFEVDPLAGITGVLAKLEQTGEEVWIQILARPVDDSWQDKGKGYIEHVKAGGSGMGMGNRIFNEFMMLPGHIILTFISAVLGAAQKDDKKPEAAKKVELSTGQQTVIKAVEEKMTKLGYGVKIRIAYLGPDEATGRQRMQAIVGGFKQFNTTNLNGFSSVKTFNSPEFIEDYQARLFFDTGSILNIEELASLYHLPHLSVETPSMVWTTSKTSEPPSNLPIEGSGEPDTVSLFGLSNFRGRNLKFGFRRRDRGRHVYIVGQTGTGKSMALELLTLSDIYHNHGMAIIDPHGDYATDMLKFIPEERLQDVIYFNPTDRDHPVAFNPMEVTDPNLKNHISSELVGVLKRMFENSWGPRLEYILRYAILALLDVEGATMLDITRLLVEKDFRKKVIREIQDPVVRNFWTTEFASWNDKFAAEAVAPILNKVGAFVANPIIRNIVGQKKSAFNIRKIMDEGKILVVNLSRGGVGEDNAAILGALMVTKIQLAAMSRADLPLDQRRPFYLYVDEFQNFATDSFAVIMSEARKYGLNLTVANQYIAQMPETVRDAVFGNVGTMVSFRIGPGDAVIMGKYFEPTFLPEDLTRLNNQHIFVSMIIDGEKSLPFSGKTLRMPDPEQDQSPKIILASQQQYGSSKTEVETDIRNRTEEGNSSDAGAPADVGSRAVATIAQSREGAAQPAFSGGDQKPNKPKSEFLSALQNPNLPPAPPQPHYDNDRRGAGNSDRRDSNRRDDRPGNNRGDRPGDRNQPRRNNERRGNTDARNEAVRQAIQSVQANLAAPQPQPAIQHQPRATPQQQPAAPHSQNPGRDQQGSRESTPTPSTAAPALHPPQRSDVDQQLEAGQPINMR